MEGPDASGRSDERPATPSEPSDASLWSIVAVLGVTQIVGYGTLFYSYPILVPAMARDLAVAPQVLFGVLSVGLLLGGLAGPRLGRAMDRHGAPHAMVIGSGLAAVLLAGAALAPGIVVFAPAIIAIEVISVIVQYDAAFASLVLFGGPRARRAITQLTLIAGFASTLF